jgi:DNA-directed RNA polymerase specialized sigma24 family protein
MRPEDIEQCRGFLRGEANRLFPSCLKAKVSPEDVVQMAMCKAIKSFESFGGTSHAQLCAWLNRILENEVKNLRRHYDTRGRDIDKEQPLPAVRDGFSNERHEVTGSASSSPSRPLRQ